MGEYIFKAPLGNKSLYEIGNDYGVKVLKFIYPSIHCQEYNVPTS